jgi:hypothetical protein
LFRFYDSITSNIASVFPYLRVNDFSGLCKSGVNKEILHNAGNRAHRLFGVKQEGVWMLSDLGYNPHFVL